MEDKHYGFYVLVVEANGNILEQYHWGTQEKALEEQAFYHKALTRGILKTPTGTGGRVLVAKIISSI